MIYGLAFLLSFLQLPLGAVGVLFGLLAVRAGRQTGGMVVAAINGMGLVTALVFLLAFVPNWR
jgi:uncharacterized membrane protein YedE/YeeE